MGEDLFFNIDNLIAPCVEEKLAEMSSVLQKTNLLLTLIDFEYNFPPTEIMEIKDFYINKTGDKYRQKIITADDKKLIQRYAQIIPDYEGIKKLISNICTPPLYDQAVASAKERIADVFALKAKQEKEKSMRLFNYDDPDYELDAAIGFTEKEFSPKKKEKKKPFSEQLKEAAQKAAILNGQRKA